MSASVPTTVAGYSRGVSTAGDAGTRTRMRVALPMTWAAFLAFLLFPLNIQLRRRLKFKSLSAGMLTVLAPVVMLLKQAGATIVGKTTTTAFAANDPTATLNPHNHGHTPGGSSSGSAAAVASITRASTTAVDSRSNE